MKKYPNLEEKPVRKLSDIDLSGVYSYANYIRWKIDERLELIRGKIYEMGAPSVPHQRVSMRISGELYLYLNDKTCEVLAAPFDVRLTHKSKDDKDITTVVQPDICVICDPLKLDRRGCIGSPDIVVEILSLGNNRKELKLKYDLYEEFGVKEYWIVHPLKKNMVKYVLNENGKYEGEGPFSAEHEVTSDLLPGFVLNLEKIFV